MGKKNDIVDLLNSKETAERFDTYNDYGLVDWEREKLFAIEAINRNPKLKGCTTNSIRMAIFNVGITGLTANPKLGYAYYVPRVVDKESICCLDIGYKGLIYAATKGKDSPIKTVTATVVRNGETFTFRGANEMPEHIVDGFPDESADVLGAYCIATLHDDTVMVEAMSIAAIEKIRAKSPAGTSRYGPWLQFPESMQRKSVIKRGSRYWPRGDQNTLVERAVAVDDETNPLILDVDSTHVLPAEEVEAIKAEVDEYKIEHVPFLQTLGVPSWDMIPVEKKPLAFSLIEQYVTKNPGDDDES